MMPEKIPTLEETRLKNEYTEKWCILKDDVIILRDDTPKEVRSFFKKYEEKYLKDL